MNREIDQQAKYIGQLNTEIDNTTQKLNFVQAKLGKLLKTNGILKNKYRYGTNMHYLNSFCDPGSDDLPRDLYMTSLF